VSWSPDSKMLASSSWLDNTMRVWDAETGKTIWQALSFGGNSVVTFNAHGNPVLGDQDELNAGLLYVVEGLDGRMNLVPYEDFRKRNLVQLTKTEVNDVLLLLRAGERGQAVGIFDRIAAEDKNGLIEWDDEIGDLFLGQELFAQAVVVYTSNTRRSKAWHWFKRRGAAYMGLGDYENALRDITTAVETKPDDSTNFTCFPQWRLWSSPPEIRERFFDLVTKAIALSSANYRIRVSYLVHQRKYEQALADLKAFSQALGRDLAEDYRLRREMALIRMAMGDETGYRIDCESLLKDFAETADPQAADVIASIVVLAPAAIENYELPRRLVGRAAELSREVSLKVTAGAIDCRAGRHQEAVKELLEANSNIDANGGDTWISLAYARYLLAISRHYLGQSTEASKCLNQADEAAKVEMNDAHNLALWDQHLVLELLRREAHELIDPRR
jgi:tetratricopeptide (TPR) repeat protein